MFPNTNNVTLNKAITKYTDEASVITELILKGK